MEENNTHKSVIYILGVILIIVTFILASNLIDVSDSKKVELNIERITKVEVQIIDSNGIGSDIEVISDVDQLRGIEKNLDEINWKSKDTEIKYAQKPDISVVLHLENDKTIQLFLYKVGKWKNKVEYIDKLIEGNFTDDLLRLLGVN